MTPVEIIPSILTSNVKEALDMITVCEGVVRRVQIDIVDGFFADNRTIDPANLGILDTSLGLDFHLMVKEPINWIEKCANAGADRIIGQIEMMESQVEFVKRVQLTNLRVGLAIDLATPVSKLDPVILTDLDVVLVMSVKAGFGGQKFDARALDKIKKLAEIRIRDRTPYRICVDGGETEKVIDESTYEGADEIVIGRRLFRSDLAGNIEKMQLASQK